MRFQFGRNWQSFLKRLDDRRIQVAEESLLRLLDLERLDGQTFLDVGCGSGLFSLAARRLGACVRSFDFDSESVACCQSLRDRFFPNDDAWAIDRGSINDCDFLRSIEPASIVYAWGVLHHTGDMWTSIGNTCDLVKPGGRLVLSIYNDQGGASRRWRFVKRLYNAAPRPIQWCMVVAVGGWMELKQSLIRLVRLQNPLPFAEWRRKKEDRGMSYWHDTIDWIGGYPFEVASPDQVFEFCRARGFVLTHLKTQLNGHGCNEFAFSRASRA